MTAKWTEFLRGTSGGVEVNRLTGFLGGLGLIGYTGYDVVWLASGFDPLAFSAGVAAIVTGTGGAVAIKDRNVATSKVIEATGSKPATPPNPAPEAKPEIAAATNGEAADDFAGLPEGLRS